MKQLTDKYNQALALIRNNQMDRAQSLLETILSIAPLHSQTLWTIGLLEVMVGKPLSGLRRWERLNPDEFPQLAAKKELVQSLLGNYEEIQLLYNKALSFAKERKYIEANEVVSAIWNQYPGIPLPEEIYKLCLLIKSLTEDQQQIVEWLDTAPDYIKNSQSILSIMQKWNEKQEEQAKGLEEEESPKKRKSLIIPTVAAGAVGVAAASLFILYSGVFNNQAGNKPAAAVSPKTETASSKQELSQLESKVYSLESEKKHFQSEMDKLNEQLEQTSGRDELYQKAGINLEAIETTKAKEAFQTGYRYLKNDNLNKAADQLELSLSLDANQYFSDDAAYFLALTQYDLNSLNLEDPIYQSFQNNQGEHYRQSPYKDDFLLLKARNEWRAGDKDAALKTIETIKNEYPKEWTFGAATSLEHTILQGS
ncbi:tetratricopeptide repeat protein [Neobacillus dielmonensis]|uniref:tetratricopeptide repeat protein n=1 Tax=Neobacillus dielmonensis TaxID=1347369 RepID=UPI0005A7F7B0|nr:tetratricopeptide repeat protein [Neobacillus dielmonensis]